MKQFKAISYFLILFCMSLNFLIAGSQENKSFTLPPLPYAEDALRPYIEKRTLELHHGKHQQANFDNLNALVKDSKFAAMSLEAVIKESAQDPKLRDIFNNAAQAWSHTFYWSSMTPKEQEEEGNRAPTGRILDLINKHFGSYDAFKKKFIDAGTKLFGSGWVWLVLDNKDKSLQIVATTNADLPLIHEQTPLLVCDIWEHAYYLDYQNRRSSYLEVFLDHLVNWKFASQNLPPE
jgi:Fe-Mn family superoxide dismutase